MRKFPLLLAFSAIILITYFQACKQRTPRPDIRDIADRLIVSRFEQMFFAADTAKMYLADEAFATQFPEFYPIYTERMMGFGAASSPESIDMMKKFITHPSLLALKKTCDSVYGENPKSFKDLREAFRYFSHYFPDKPLPHVVTMISEFGFATAYMDSTLAIGLDMYLGRNYPFYPGVGFPSYIIKNMEPANLVPQAIQAWARAIFEQDRPGQRFLDKMISEGKFWYMSSLLMPDLPDSLITGLTSEQLKWCDENQFQMWTHFIENKLLYETDRTVYNAFISEAPFTVAPGVPPESSPLLGKYAGWQIVKRYMKKNPQLSLLELMENYNADEILAKSGYRP